MRYFIIAFIFGFSIILTGCTKITINTTNQDEKTKITAEEPEIQIDMTDINYVSHITIQALKNKDITVLSQISNTKGIRFSPYSFVDVDKNIIIKKEEIGNIMDSQIEYVWGYQDGSGDPIIMKFAEYMDKFIYDTDFAALAERHVNENIMRGNTINNVSDIYTGKYIIEYYVPGQNTQYEGLDWKSLTLVFSQDEKNERKLEAIIHNQRTI